jgi:hypothetical protein
MGENSSLHSMRCVRILETHLGMMIPGTVGLEKEGTLMKAIHIRKKLESDTLQLPELKPMIGEMVEITVQVAASAVVKNAWDEIDRIAAKNAEIYPGPDVGVEIIRAMRGERDFQGRA